MFFKRQLAVVVMIMMGVISLSGYFINIQELRNFTDKDATNFYMIIAGFAAFLGCFNLLQLHLQKITYQKENWQYSIFTLLGFLIMIYFGFINKGIESDPFTDINNNGKWDDAEEYVDNNLNGIFDLGESFIDVNDNGKWDKAEPFNDIYGNYNYDYGEKFTDANGDEKWNEPESFEDLPDGDYTFVKWGAHLKNKNSMFYWFYDKFYLPLGATMFALLAFFVASASYRAFRIRNFEATLLLIAGVLLMLGRVPLGAMIPWWLVLVIYISIIFSLLAHKIIDKKLFFISYSLSIVISIIIGMFLSWNQSTPAFLSIPIIQEWIMSVPATAGSRAIMIGIALGIIAQSFRIITGRERSILGD